MRRFMSTLCAVLAHLAVGLAPTLGQQVDLNAVLNRFKEYYAAGNFSAALSEAQKLESAVKARFGTDHVNYALALDSIAGVYERQSRYAEALAHYQRALQIREAKLGRDHLDVAQTLKDIADVYNSQGQYAEALA